MSHQQYEDSYEDPVEDPDRDRRNRSIDLIQTIVKQLEKKAHLPVPEEVLEAFKQGVDIDCQDGNREFFTYLHFAVSKFGVKFVKFLLKFKPDLKIKNIRNNPKKTPHETPIEMAKSLAEMPNARQESRDIYRMLLNASSLEDSIDPRFIYEIFCNEISKQKLDAIRQNPRIKVLRIKGVPSIEELFRILRKDNSIREMTNIFFFDIHVLGRHEGFTVSQYDALNQIFLKKGLLIIQITPARFDPILYSKEKSTIQKLQIAQPCISRDELKQKLFSKYECNFNLLIRVFEYYGVFKKDLLDIKLPKDDGRNRLVDCFASKNALCLSFFKLFDETLDNEQRSRRYGAVMKCHDVVPCLRAFLDHPPNTEDRGFRLSYDQREQLFWVDSRKYDLLMIAIENNNVEAVNYLVQYGFNLNKRFGPKRETAVDLAWNYKFYDCFNEIIQADSHFPLDFNVNRIPFGVERETFEKTMRKKYDFLINVSKGNLDKVKQFVESNPQVKRCYSISNKSALTGALEFEKYEVYSYLRSVGFSAEHDSYFDDFYANSDKEKIRVFNKKYFHGFVEPHLIELLKKSILSYDATDREKCYQTIMKMYSKLNKIKEISAFLKLIARSEKLEIFFDFNLNNVSNMDPSKNSDTRGTCYHKTGSIYIGAKNYDKDSHKIHGTLAHELCHFAIFLVYGNDCLPYLQTDNTNREAFRKVYDDTRKFYKTDPLIRTVFEGYTKYAVQLAELIVRIPQILAEYEGDDDGISYLRIVFCALFDFFDKRVYRVICKVNDNEDSLSSSMSRKDASTDTKVKILTKNSSILTLDSFYHTSQTVERTFDYPHMLPASVFMEQKEIRNSYHIPNLLKRQHACKTHERDDESL